MGYKDDLYDLIHSLDKAEKRYFKLFASKYEGQEENRYIKLFEILNSFKEYDKETIQKRIKAAKLTKNLIANKNYLYNLLLKSLRQFHENKDAHSQISTVLDNVRILMKKGLFDKCFGLLRKAKNLAKRYEKLNLGLEALTLERKIIQETTKQDEERSIRMRLQNQEELEVFIAQNNNLKDYLSLGLKISDIGFKIFDKKEQYDPALFEHFLEEKLLQNESQALTLQAKHYLHTIKLNCFFYLKDYRQYRTTALRAVRMWDGIEEDILVEYQRIYINNLFNLLIFEVYQESDEVFQQTLKTLKDTYENKAFKDSHSVLFVRCFSIELEFISSRGALSEALKLIEKSKKNYLQHSVYGFASDVVGTTFLIGRIYFYYGQYEEAQEWLDRLINDYSNTDREDLLAVANVLKLIIYFESDETLLIDYLARSIYRFVKRRRNMHKSPLSVVKYIKKLVATPSKREHKKIYEKLLKELLKLKATPAEDMLMTYIFDFPAWVESKIQGKPLMDVLKNK